MRILILDNEFPPIGGGTGVVNFHIMSELDLHEHIQVDLVTSSRTKDLFEVSQFGEHSQIFKVPVDNKNIHHSSNAELLRYTFRGLRQALHLMHQQPYDICWAYAAVPAGFIALFLYLQAGLPYILITQGPDIPWFEKRYYSHYPILIPLIKVIWNKAVVVTAQSIASKELITRTSPRLPVEIIHNGVEIERFAPTTELLSQRCRRQPITFFCSGRLIERKGQHHLLQAADLLIRRGHTGHFRIILSGTGDNEEQLHQQCDRMGLQDSVQFTGFVSRETLLKCYADADVFVLPSYNEGMSIALLEALASGLPVIVTDTGGSAELVDNNGFIVPWANPVFLADMLERFLLEPDLCQRMGAKSHEIAKGFSWQATTKAYLELSSRCLLDSQSA